MYALLHPVAVLAALGLSSLPALAGAHSPPDDPATRALMQRAAAVVPSDRQLAWQRLEFQCFIHFGMNTFTGREWGDGSEDPGIFNPTDLDADQWAGTAKHAGMKGIVLVAKHHDGFCLWPSSFTEHSVKNSPWKGGKGDVVREVADACKKHNLKFGVYLSPADLHEPTYGDSHKYNQYFLDQLRELLTSYGPVHEVWFDGATPKDKGQVYDYQAWYKLIRELQPGAVIFGRGPDVRWVGNEGGAGRASEWSVIPLGAPAEQCTWPDLTAGDLGSLAKLKDSQHLHWYPAETDTSIRPGWFWRETENARVRSLDDLLNVYYNSVGNNCVLLLNVPPDRRGALHENDIARLRELGATLQATFAANLATGAKASSESSIPGHEAPAIVDGNPDTYWTTSDWENEPTLTISLAAPRQVSVVMLQEHIQSGQRVERFTVEAWDAQQWATAGSGWREVASGTTIGYKKLARFPAIQTDRLRVTFLESRVRPAISEFGAFVEPVRLAAPSIKRDRAGAVSITTLQASASQILYTLDGSDPVPGTPATFIYSKPFPFPKAGEVRALTLPRDASSVVAPGQIARVEFDVCKATWTIISVSSDQGASGEGAANLIDDNPSTIWHTRYMPDTPKQPHEVVIDLGESLTLKGFTYLPRQNGPNGTILKYEVSLSSDGKNWGKPVAAGEFPNIKNNPMLQRIPFSEPTPARYLKFVALSEINGQPWASAAELGVITQ
ncbi:MAG: alpha-L-fucosidase [Pyrinomonadaceae bacterium]|nr:alpha-L-fucosidase [Phycisphaerales bacterium]